MTYTLHLDTLFIRTGARLTCAVATYQGASPSPPTPGYTFTVSDPGGSSTTQVIDWSDAGVALLNAALAARDAGGPSTKDITATAFYTPAATGAFMLVSFQVFFCEPQTS
jgi:hypothetical protein